MAAALGKALSRKTLTDRHTALATEAGHHQACVALQHQQIEEIFEPSTHIPSESFQDAFALLFFVMGERNMQVVRRMDTPSAGLSCPPASSALPLGASSAAVAACVWTSAWRPGRAWASPMTSARSRSSDRGSCSGSSPLHCSSSSSSSRAAAVAAASEVSSSSSSAAERLSMVSSSS